MKYIFYAYPETLAELDAGKLNQAVFADHFAGAVTIMVDPAEYYVFIKDIDRSGVLLVRIHRKLDERG
jgi:hypothetical protein